VGSRLLMRISCAVNTLRVGLPIDINMKVFYISDGGTMRHRVVVQRSGMVQP
jgi:hypothetical protein